MKRLALILTVWLSVFAFAFAVDVLVFGHRERYSVYGWSRDQCQRRAAYFQDEYLFSSEQEPNWLRLKFSNVDDPRAVWCGPKGAEITVDKVPHLSGPDGYGHYHITFNP